MLQNSNPRETFNLAILEGAKFALPTLRVHVRAYAGERDRGGGLCFALTDTDNYRVVYWDALRNVVVLGQVSGGELHELRAGGIGEVAPGWHELGVAVHGDRLRAYFDRVEVTSITVHAPVLSGQVGLWTRGDAATWFDELRVY